MKKLTQVVLHEIIVLLHIIASVGVAAIGIIVLDPKFETAFVQGLVHYGIPVTIANIIVVAITKSIDLKNAEISK